MSPIWLSNYGVDKTQSHSIVRQDNKAIKSLARNLPSDSFIGIWMYFLPVTNQTSFTSKVTTAQRAFEVSVPLMDLQNVVLENRDGG